MLLGLVCVDIVEKEIVFVFQPPSLLPTGFVFCHFFCYEIL